MTSKAKVGRPKGRSKEETLAMIMPVARQFFAEKGFAQTTIKDVANAVGLSHAALYSYFSSKQDLYISAVTATQDALFPFYLAAFEQGENLRERLSLILKAMAAEHDKDSSITGLLAAVPIEIRRHPELFESLSSSNNAIMLVLEGMFEEAKSCGEITSSASAEDLVAVFLGGGVGVSLWQYGHGRENLASTMDVFLAVVGGEIFAEK